MGEAWEKGRVKDCYWPVVSGQLRERRRGTQACCRGRMPIGGPGERYFGQTSGFSCLPGLFCTQVFGEQFVDAKYMASPSPTFASLLALTPSHPEDNVPAYRGMKSPGVLRLRGSRNMSHLRCWKKWAAQASRLLAWEVLARLCSLLLAWRVGSFQSAKHASSKHQRSSKRQTSSGGTSMGEFGRIGSARIGLDRGRRRDSAVSLSYSQAKGDIAPYQPNVPCRNHIISVTISPKLLCSNE